MMGLQFRLYTEDIDIDRIINYATVKGLKNLTVYKVDGKYNGVDEKSIIIEYIMPVDRLINDIDNVRETFKKLSNCIKKFNNQDCVLLTEQKVNFELY